MEFLPYGRQDIGEDDIEAVVEVLRGDWLTTGPKVREFELHFAETVGAAHAVAVSNGTAALHCAIKVLDLAPGDEVIVPTMTFAATANSVVFQGATPVFADVETDTLLLDPASVEARITRRTKAVVTVDYAGHPSPYNELLALCRQRDLTLVADACHGLGATYHGHPVGSLATLNTFSFHPVKPIATGEGGMVATDHPGLAEGMRRFRNHGITTDHRERANRGSWFYEMVDLGYNYRLTDIQCALGISQLRKLPAWVERRRTLAARYDQAFASTEAIHPLAVRPGVKHAYHLYVIQLLGHALCHRDSIFNSLREKDIGANVHYIPVHLHPFYRRHLKTCAGLCPNAEKAYRRILTLPLFPSMSNSDVDRVSIQLLEVLDSLP